MRTLTWTKAYGPWINMTSHACLSHFHKRIASVRKEDRSVNTWCFGLVLFTLHKWSKSHEHSRDRVVYFQRLKVLGGLKCVYYVWSTIQYYTSRRQLYYVGEKIIQICKYLWEVCYYSSDLGQIYDDAHVNYPIFGCLWCIHIKLYNGWPQYTRYGFWANLTSTII